MKTTLDLPDDLYRQVKAIAALKGQSVKEWLTQLLRREVAAVDSKRSAAKDAEQEAEAFVQELNRMTALVSARWQGAQDAVAAIREQRRDFAA